MNSHSPWIIHPFNGVFFACFALFLLLLVFTVQHQQKAEEHCNQCVGVENQVDQVIFVTVVISIDEKIDSKKREYDGDRIDQLFFSELHVNHDLSAAVIGTASVR